MSKEAQVDRLFNYMQEHGWINAVVAWHKLGIYRLSARIYDVRKQGWEVRTRWIKGSNRFGEPVKWKEYSL